MKNKLISALMSRILDACHKELRNAINIFDSLDFTVVSSAEEILHGKSFQKNLLEIHFNFKIPAITNETKNVLLNDAICEINEV